MTPQDHPNTAGQSAAAAAQTAGPAAPRVGILLDAADAHHASMARQLAQELASSFQLSLYATPAQASAAIGQLDLLLDFSPAAPALGRSDEVARKTIRYVSGAAAAAGKSALTGARAVIVDGHASAARHAATFPQIVALERGVDCRVYRVAADRHGPLRFGWVGDARQHAVNLNQLLIPAMRGDVTISVMDAQASPQQLADFYNIIDVLLILSEQELGAQTMPEALACGVFALNASGAGLPACVSGHDGGHVGGLSIDASAPALRAAMLWCVDNGSLVRQRGAQNAHAMALHGRWPVVAPRWGRFLQEEFTLATAGRTRSAPPCDLLLLDDIYPLLLSAFRITEYNAYLSHFPTAAVHSTGKSFSIVKETRSFDAVRTAYEARYPAYAGRVTRYDPKWLPDARLAYLLFINNAYDFCEVLEASNTPFVFCLYPGGGFAIDGAESDRKLRRVFASPCFRKVLCTQKISYDYLLRKGLCAPEQMEFIYGGVLPTRVPSSTAKRRYKENKARFDICFVASKYSPRGVDKGYDLFIAAAKMLCARHDDIFFHVVGNFDASDIDVAELAGRLTFHGLLSTDELSHFFRDMEIMLSPNRAFILSPGSFDGFPTGAGAEAGINEVALFTSDPLHLSPFVDGEDIVIIDTNADSIVAAVERYYAAPDQLYRLAARTAQSYAAAFHPDAQIGPRLRLLEQQLALLPGAA